jgi:hypothetical protein
MTFGLMALRRWRSEFMHSLSKPYALGLLIAFLAVLMGNVWPAITGRRLPFPIFGNTDIAEMAPAIAIGFPIVYALVTWLLCLLLFAIVIPDRHAWLRGLRRARKHGRRTEPPWADDAADLRFMALFVGAVLIGFWVLYDSMLDAGLLASMSDIRGSLWRLPVTLGLVLVYSLLLIQVIGLKPAALVVLLVWLLPILAAIVLSAITQSATSSQAVIASLSPLALLLMAGSFALDGSVPTEATGQLDILLTGFRAGLLLVVAEIVVLGIAWHRRSSQFEQRAAVTSRQTASRPAARPPEAHA